MGGAVIAKTQTLEVSGCLGGMFKQLGYTLGLFFGNIE
jgi:hypothetical protein